MRKVSSDVATQPTTDNGGGSIHYRASASLADVAAGAGTALDLGKRHIVLHGVNPATPLDQAASLHGLPAWLTLPVGCGELEPAG